MFGILLADNPEHNARWSYPLTVPLREVCVALKSAPVVRQPSFNSSPVARSAGSAFKTCRHARQHTHSTKTKKNKNGADCSALDGEPSLREEGKKKVHRPPLGCHTAAQACVHLWRTRRALLPHGTARPFYLQMVPLGRNVTFDSVPLTERASGPVRSGAVRCVATGRLRPAHR